MNFQRINLLILTAVILSGCSAKITPLSENTYLVKCEQMLGEMGDCVALAKKQCPMGYDVISAKDETSLMTGLDKNKVVPYVGGVKRSMLIKCQH
ncbi:hypothetical protein [Rosenbergiella nectarea]|uniref:hypothetical protein n=1 Tax=Rosenbergiella nectarea TaxID=988801 RepID=UPI001BDA09B1|nr:hypothetical protein [Rosenbergiella nectarea]MBT0728909.1 hypothetical protein [Rosenbergiella nectarea subsp. apis]